MAAACEVVELIGMETQSSIGCQVKGNDAYRSASVEKHSFREEMLPVRRSVQAERPRRQSISPRLTPGAGGRGSARDRDRDGELLVRAVRLGHRLACGGATGLEHSLAGPDRVEVGGIGVGPTRSVLDLLCAVGRSRLKD